MADLPLLAKTFEAAPDCSRILLLGDKDQLSSVEAGGAGDICDTGNEHGYSRRFISMAAETAGQAIDSSEARDDEPPVADSRVILRKAFASRVKAASALSARPCVTAMPNGRSMRLPVGGIKISPSSIWRGETPRVWKRSCHEDNRRICAVLRFAITGRCVCAFFLVFNLAPAGRGRMASRA